MPRHFHEPVDALAMADTLPMIEYSELSRKHAALLAAVASMELGDAAPSYTSDAALAVENEMLRQQLASARAEIAALSADFELLRRTAAREHNENDALKRALRTLRLAVEQTAEAVGKSPADHNPQVSE